MRTIVLVLAAAPVLAPAALAGQDPGARSCPDQPAEAAIERVRAAYMDAFNAGRIDAVVALHTDDVVSMPAGRPPLHGREALRKIMAESFRAAPEGFRFEFDAEELRVADGWAVERGATRASMGGRGADAGEGVPGGKYVLLYEREDDGCWRIAWSITNTDGG
jgi:uncharacterized protein (TIGR02246 family)